jgi:hypothetical protein
MGPRQEKYVAHLVLTKRLDTKDLDHCLLDAPQLVVHLIPCELTHMGMRPAMVAHSMASSIRGLNSS